MTATYTWSPAGVALSWSGASAGEGKTLPQCVGAYLQNRSDRSIELRRVTAFWPLNNTAVSAQDVANHFPDLVRLVSAPSGGALATARRHDENATAMPGEVEVRRLPSIWSASSKIRSVPPIQAHVMQVSNGAAKIPISEIYEIVRDRGGHTVTGWIIREGEGVALVPNMMGDRLGTGAGAFDAQLVLRNTSTGACHSYFLPGVVLNPSGGVGMLSVWNGSGSGVTLELVKLDIMAVGCRWGASLGTLGLKAGAICLYRVPAGLTIASTTGGIDVYGEAIQWDVMSHDTDKPMPDGIAGGSITGHVGSMSLDDGSVATLPNHATVPQFVASSRWAAEHNNIIGIAASTGGVTSLQAQPSRSFSERRLRHVGWTPVSHDTAALRVPQNVAGVVLNDHVLGGWIIRPGEALAIAAPPYSGLEQQGLLTLPTPQPINVVDLEVTFNVVPDSSVRQARAVGGQWARGIMP